MPVMSAALLPYLVEGDELLVWLAHMGGPFWQHKDEAAWTVVKGEYSETEPAEDAAVREWAEEMGSAPPPERRLLGAFRQSSKKTVTVFAAQVPRRDTVQYVSSSSVEIEWPPRSGRTTVFPEIDRAQWFPLAEAQAKILSGQRQILEALRSAHLTGGWPAS